MLDIRNYRNETIHNASYEYFFSFYKQSKSSLHITNAFKSGQNLFSEVERASKCLIRISIPTVKKYSMHCLIEGFIDQMNGGDWNKCKDMLTDIFLINAVKNNELFHPISFTMKSIQKIPIFSHFFIIHKKINEAVIRNEFIRKKMINGLEDFCSKQNCDSIVLSRKRRSFSIDNANIQNKTFSRLKNSQDKCSFHERWHYNYINCHKNCQSDVMYSFKILEITQNENKIKDSNAIFNEISIANTQFLNLKICHDKCIPNIKTLRPSLINDSLLRQSIDHTKLSTAEPPMLDLQKEDDSFIDNSIREIFINSDKIEYQNDLHKSCVQALVTKTALRSQDKILLDNPLDSLNIKQNINSVFPVTEVQIEKEMIMKKELTEILEQSYFSLQKVDKSLKQSYKSTRSLEQSSLFETANSDSSIIISETEEITKVAYPVSIKTEIISEINPTLTLILGYEIINSLCDKNIVSVEENQSINCLKRSRLQVSFADFDTVPYIAYSNNVSINDYYFNSTGDSEISKAEVRYLPNSLKNMEELKSLQEYITEYSMQFVRINPDYFGNSQSHLKIFEMNCNLSDFLKTECRSMDVTTYSITEESLRD